MSFLLYTLVTLFIFVCFLLIMIILIQKGRGGGLASAFGGGGGNTAFGAKTGDVLTWVTSVIFGIFLLLAIALNLVSNRYQKNYVPRGPVAPVAPVSPAPTPTESVPPLTTDSRPTTEVPTTPAPGQGAATPGVTAPAPATQP